MASKKENKKANKKENKKENMDESNVEVPSTSSARSSNKNGPQSNFLSGLTSKFLSVGLPNVPKTTLPGRKSLSVITAQLRNKQNKALERTSMSALPKPTTSLAFGSGASQNSYTPLVVGPCPKNSCNYAFIPTTSSRICECMRMPNSKSDEQQDQIVRASSYKLRSSASRKQEQPFKAQMPSSIPKLNKDQTTNKKNKDQEKKVEEVKVTRPPLQPNYRFLPNPNSTVFPYLLGLEVVADYLIAESQNAEEKSTSKPKPTPTPKKKGPATKVVKKKN